MCSGVTLKFKLGQHYLTLYLPTKYHHPTFNPSEIILLTKKQIHKQTNRDCAENIHLAPLGYASEKSTAENNNDSDGHKKRSVIRRETLIVVRGMKQEAGSKDKNKHIEKKLFDRRATTCCLVAAAQC